ncbi:hypothetical protein BGW42_006174 [Actinomortierella wolfii]|nr:hypothetical protein BGW42_006174 [Actinomortierella wolfii]
MAPVSERLASTSSTTVERAEAHGLNGSNTGTMTKEDDPERMRSSAGIHMDVDDFHSTSGGTSQLKVEDSHHRLHDASSVATSEDEKDEDDEDENENEDDNEDEGDGSNFAPEDANLGGDSVVCRWKDCSQVLPSLSALVIHLSDDHIGWKKTSYTMLPKTHRTNNTLCTHLTHAKPHQAQALRLPSASAMAKHLRCQHGDVPERFTGRKSRGRYTMRNPTASSTLLDSVTRKRRHGEDKYDSDQSRTASGRRRYGGRGGRKAAASQQQEESEESGEDSDLAIDNGQSLKERYGILKAKFRYITNERDSLECEYTDAKKKLRRLQVEREVLLDALAAQMLDLGDNLDAIEDSDEDD